MATQDLLDKAFVTRVINEMETSQVRQRRIDEWKLFRIYNGDGKVYTQERLESLYPQSYSSMHRSDINLLKRVTDTVAKAYNHGVVRTLDGDDESNTLSEIYDDNHFNHFWNTYDIIYNRHRYAGMWAVPREFSDGSQKIVLEPLNPWEFAVVRNQDTREVEMVVLNYPDTNVTGQGDSGAGQNDGVDQAIAEHQADSSAHSRVYSFWTKDQHAVWEVVGSGKNAAGQIKTTVTYVPIEGNAQNINPLGILPFVFDWKEDAVDLPVLNDMGEFTVEINAMMSSLLTASSKQGFGQLIISRPENFKIEAIHAGITTAMDLPQPPEGEGAVTAQYINANPDLAGQLETYSAYISAKLKEHGIQAAEVTRSSNSQEFSSGLDRLISKADVVDLVGENQARYRVSEQKIYKILKRYGEIGLLQHKGKQIRLISEELMVHYKKPKVMISDMELLLNIEKQLAMGMIEEWEKYRVIDPNLSEEEAKEKLERVNEEKQAKMDAFMGDMENGGRDEEDRPEAGPDIPESEGRSKGPGGE